jgi:hypothetical protein
MAVSAREEQFRRAIDELPFDPANGFAWFGAVRELERQAVASYSPRRAHALFERLVRNGTRLSPTLTVLRVFASPADTFAHDPRLKYIPGYFRTYWEQQIGRIAPSTPEQIAQQRQYFRDRSRLVATARRDGVGILAGTDCSNPYSFPGFSLHDELALLVDGGLTAMQALQSATRDAARYLGLGHQSGTVTAGKHADLVVLDANPLTDIRNTQRINAVVAAGRYLDAAERATLLAQVEEAAKEPPPATPSGAVPRSCGCHGAPM